MGVIDTAHREINGISENTRQLIQSHCVLAAPHLSALLQDVGHDRPDLSEVIADLAHLPRSDSLHSTYANITECASRTLHASRANIWLLDEEASKLTCIDHFDLSTAVHSDAMILARDGYPDYFSALQDERVIMANDAKTDPPHLRIR